MQPMKTRVGGSASIAFLVCSGTIGYFLLKDPGRLADRAERLGWWIPPLETLGLGWDESNSAFSERCSSS